MKSSKAFCVADGGLSSRAVAAPERITGRVVSEPAPWASSWILFTTNSIICLDGDFGPCRLDEIVGYEHPKSKVNVTGGRVRTREGFLFVRIAGPGGDNDRHHHERDAFRLLMVLRAILPGAPLVS